ncbi:MAG: hypothetical protein AAF667_01300 [Pseudomonadota bacterium]
MSGFEARASLYVCGAWRRENIYDLFAIRSCAETAFDFVRCPLEIALSDSHFRAAAGQKADPLLFRMDAN